TTAELEVLREPNFGYTWYESEHSVYRSAEKRWLLKDIKLESVVSYCGRKFSTAALNKHRRDRGNVIRSSHV
ncbi:hypothetical protein BgiBS90_013441, partial [Biomphalaria glabrata]